LAQNSQKPLGQDIVYLCGDLRNFLDLNVTNLR